MNSTWTGKAKTQGVISIPQDPIQKAIFPGRAGCQHFSIYLQLPVTKAMFWLNMVERWRQPSLSQSPLGCSSLGRILLSILWIRYLYPISCSGHFKTKRSKLKRLEGAAPISTKHSAPKKRMTPREQHAISILIMYLSSSPERCPRHFIHFLKKIIFKNIKPHHGKYIRIFYPKPDALSIGGSKTDN